MNQGPSTRPRSRSPCVELWRLSSLFVHKVNSHLLPTFRLLTQTADGRHHHTLTIQLYPARAASCMR